MTIRKFGYFSPSDYSDLSFSHDLAWSRVYEYPFALGWIYHRKDAEDPTIHNCSWGFRDIHVVFKTKLDVLSHSTKHTDVIPSSLVNTGIWDITKPYKNKDHFDFVVNISTIEEVQGDHVQIIKNHLDQVRPGGFFIMTFDVPGIQLDKVEEFLGRKIEEPGIRLNPHNSVLPDKVLGLPDTFNVGHLIIEK